MAKRKTCGRDERETEDITNITRFSIQSNFNLSWLHIYWCLLIVLVLPVGRVSAVGCLLQHNRRILLRSKHSGLAPRYMLSDAEQDDKAEGMEKAADV